MKEDSRKTYDRSTNIHNHNLERNFQEDRFDIHNLDYNMREDSSQIFELVVAMMADCMGYNPH